MQALTLLALAGLGLFLLALKIPANHPIIRAVATAGTGIGILAAIFVFVFPAAQAADIPQEGDFDPQRVTVITTLALAIPELPGRPCPEENRSYYSYFVKPEGNMWFEVSEDPCNFQRFMFRQARISKDEIELVDDTRNPQITVRLRLNLKENKIYYKEGDKAWVPLYEIVEIQSSNK